MLVIISDLHLTDGTSGSTISPWAFEIFVQELRDAAISASWRPDGNYRPVDRIDLLLLGDTLDVIRSARWLDAAVRPWDSTDRPEFVELVSIITGDILRHNESSLAAAKPFNTGPVLPCRRPTRSAARKVRPGIPVPVATHYLVGNHDWFYHLPAGVRSATPGDHPPDLVWRTRSRMAFSHDPSENGELVEVLRKHRVLARHGDIYDPINFEGDRKLSSLGDAIVIELLNRFAVQVDAKWPTNCRPRTLLGLRELDNVRPLLMVPVWIDGLLARTCPLPHVRRVKVVWDQLVDRFLALPFVRSLQKRGRTIVVDRLEQVLKFSKRVSIGWASKIVTLLGELRGQQIVVLSACPGRTRIPQPTRQVCRLRPYPLCRDRAAGGQLCRRLSAEPDLLQFGHVAAGAAPDGRRLPTSTSSSAAT